MPSPRRRRPDPPSQPPPHPQPPPQPPADMSPPLEHSQSRLSPEKMRRYPYAAGMYGNAVDDEGSDGSGGGNIKAEHGGGGDDNNNNRLPTPVPSSHNAAPDGAYTASTNYQQANYQQHHDNDDDGGANTNTGKGTMSAEVPPPLLGPPDGGDDDASSSSSPPPPIARINYLSRSDSSDRSSGGGSTSSFSDEAENDYDDGGGGYVSSSNTSRSTLLSRAGRSHSSSFADAARFPPGTQLARLVQRPVPVHYTIAQQKEQLRQQEQQQQEEQQEQQEQQQQQQEEEEMMELEGTMVNMGIIAPVVSFDGSNGVAGGAEGGHGDANATGEEAVSEAGPVVPPAGAATVKQDGGLAAQAAAAQEAEGEAVRAMSPVMMAQLAFAAGRDIGNNNDDAASTSTSTGGDESVLPLEDLEEDKPVDVSALTEEGSAGGDDNEDDEYLDEEGDDTMMRMEDIDLGAELEEEEVAEGRAAAAAEDDTANSSSHHGAEGEEEEKLPTSAPSGAAHSQRRTSASASVSSQRSRASSILPLSVSRRLLQIQERRHAALKDSGNSLSARFFARAVRRATMDRDVASSTCSGNVAADGSTRASSLAELGPTLAAAAAESPWNSSDSEGGDDAAPAEVGGNDDNHYLEKAEDDAQTPSLVLSTSLSTNDSALIGGAIIDANVNTSTSTASLPTQRKPSDHSQLEQCEWLESSEEEGDDTDDNDSSGTPWGAPSESSVLSSNAGSAPACEVYQGLSEEETLEEEVILRNSAIADDVDEYQIRQPISENKHTVDAPGQAAASSEDDNEPVHDDTSEPSRPISTRHAEEGSAATETTPEKTPEVPATALRAVAEVDHAEADSAFVDEGAENNRVTQSVRPDVMTTAAAVGTAAAAPPTSADATPSTSPIKRPAASPPPREHDHAEVAPKRSPTSSSLGLLINSLRTAASKSPVEPGAEVVDEDAQEWGGAEGSNGAFTGGSDEGDDNSLGKPRSLLVELTQSETSTTVAEDPLVSAEDEQSDSTASSASSPLPPPPPFPPCDSSRQSSTDPPGEHLTPKRSDAYMVQNGDAGVYKGDTVNGTPHGEGTMTFANGTVYSGGWENGNPSGDGTLYLPGGDVRYGKWSGSSFDTGLSSRSVLSRGNSLGGSEFLADDELSAPEPKKVDSSTSMTRSVDPSGVNEKEPPSLHSTVGSPKQAKHDHTDAESAASGSSEDSAIERELLAASPPDDAPSNGPSVKVGSAEDRMSDLDLESGEVGKDEMQSRIKRRKRQCWSCVPFLLVLLGAAMLGGGIYVWYIYLGPGGNDRASSTSPADSEYNADVQNEDSFGGPSAVTTSSSPADASPLSSQTLAPTHSPTSWVGHTTFSFYVFSDGPYVNDEVAELADQLASLTTKSNPKRGREGALFAVHAGNIMKGGDDSDCSEWRFKMISDIMSDSSPVPMLVMPGDNEWADCPSPVVAKSQWMKYFGSLGINTPFPTAVERQSRQQENFAFAYNGILFLGVNTMMIDGSTAGNESELRERMNLNAAWISEQLREHSFVGPEAGNSNTPTEDDIRGIILFGHSWYEPLFIDVGTSLQETGVPIVFIHGDGYEYRVVQHLESEGFDDLWSVQLDHMGIAPPMKITVQGTAPRTDRLRANTKDQRTIANLIKLDRRGAMQSGVLGDEDGSGDVV